MRPQRRPSHQVTGISTWYLRGNPKPFNSVFQPLEKRCILNDLVPAWQCEHLNGSRAGTIATTPSVICRRVRRCWPPFMKMTNKTLHEIWEVC